jgi:cytochrome c oxidase cbb3-type subunit 3
LRYDRGTIGIAAGRMTAARGIVVAAMLATMLSGCAREGRLLASDQPQTPPDGPADPRARRYGDNFYQLAQGGRYFTWYGCAGCHGPTAKGTLDLADGRWVHGGAANQIYAFIAAGHPSPLPRYGERIPVEQLWQITAFVRDLPQEDPAKTRRNALDQQGEPQGASWQGPVP